MNELFFSAAYSKKMLSSLFFPFVRSIAIKNRQMFAIYCLVNIENSTIRHVHHSLSHCVRAKTATRIFFCKMKKSRIATLSHSHSLVNVVTSRSFRQSQSHHPLEHPLLKRVAHRASYQSKAEIKLCRSFLEFLIERAVT